MLPTRVRVVFGVVILMGLFLRATGYTSADLFAERAVRSNLFSMTTLSFLELNTANNSHISRLFEISGMVPLGFAVSSVRIKKDGQLDFRYRLRTAIIAGNEAFCHSLQLKLMKEGVVRASGNVVDFNYESGIIGENPDDLVLFIDFDSLDPSLRQQNCQFDMIFSTLRNGGGNGGIRAEGKLSNFVSSGNWE